MEISQRGKLVLIPGDPDGAMTKVMARLEATERSRTEGFVYFVECAGYVKIGYSMDPRRRALSYGVMNPLECRLLGYVPGGKIREREIQGQFADVFHRGEWFRLTDEVRERIAALIELPTSSV